MATVSNDADEIRRQMAEIRRELHKDVREVVASAEAVTDWHRYFRNYPWAAIGAAVAVGYMLVPRRHKVVVPVSVQVPAPGGVAPQTVEATVKEKERKGLLAAAFGLVAPIAVRAAQSYAMQYLENWIIQQQASAAGPSPAARPGPAERRGTGERNPF